MGQKAYAVLFPSPMLSTEEAKKIGEKIKSMKGVLSAQFNEKGPAPVVEFTFDPAAQVGEEIKKIQGVMNVFYEQ